MSDVLKRLEPVRHAHADPLDERGRAGIGSQTAQPTEHDHEPRLLSEQLRARLPHSGSAIALIPETSDVDDMLSRAAEQISGGTGGNIIPEWCTFQAEARSQDEQKLNEIVQEMLDAFAFAASETDCEVETSMRKSYLGYRFKQDEEVVQLAAKALERCGYAPSYALSGGGADANVFNERGRRCVNLANGMTDIHTPDERIAVGDLDAMVDVTLALVESARA